LGASAGTPISEYEQFAFKGRMLSVSEADVRYCFFGGKAKAIFFAET
jgi:hypothetical protein